MCYSKEVSLVAGSAILAVSSYNIVKWQLFKNKEDGICSQIPGAIKFLTLGFVCIGLHQFFEFFAISYQNIFVYKLGLVTSISAMYFNIRSSEIFLRKYLHSKLVFLLISLTGIHIFSREVVFENYHFYVRGESHFYWGAIWLLLFLYWNFIHIFSLNNIGDKRRSFTMLLPISALNISFILSAVYCYSIGLYQNLYSTKPLAQVCAGLFSSFEIVFDAPSIWCVFATLQGPLIIWFSNRLMRYRDMNFPRVKGSVIKPIICSLVLVFTIFLSLPLVSSLSYKMMLK